MPRYDPAHRPSVAPVSVAGLVTRFGRFTARVPGRGRPAFGLAVALCAALTGCAGRAPEPGIGPRVEQAISAVRDLRVTTFWDDDACTYIAYQRGTFSANPADEGCWVLGDPPARLLDSQAVADIARVTEAFQSVRLTIEYIAAVYDEAGGIAADSMFSIDRCQTSVFDPGGTDATEDLPDGATALRDGPRWYLVDYCG